MAHNSSRSGTLLVVCVLMLASAGCKSAGGARDGDAPDIEVQDGPCMLPDVPCVEEACHEPPYHIGCVGSTVVDREGNPVTDQRVTLCGGGVCGGLVCMAVHLTDTVGWFSVPFPPDVDIDSGLGVQFPGRQFLNPYCRFFDLCDGLVNLCYEFILYPAPTEGTALTVDGLGADLAIESTDGASLVLPEGARLVNSEFYLPEMQWMALSRFPLEEHVPCFLRDQDLPMALYAITPHDSLVLEEGTDVLDESFMHAMLDLPNFEDDPPGTRFDVYIVTGLEATLFDLKLGQWERWTSAVVTPDGGRIQTPPGEGLNYLTWFGIYRSSP